MSLVSEVIALVWSLLFDHFGVALTVWSAIKPQGALLLPFHNNFAELSGFRVFFVCLYVLFFCFFSFSILHRVHNRTQVGYSHRIRRLFVRYDITDRCERTLTQQFSPSLVFWLISLIRNVRPFILLQRGQMSHQFCVTQGICSIGTPLDTFTPLQDLKQLVEIFHHLWNDLPEETIRAKTPQSFRSSVEAWLQGNKAHWTPRSLLSLVGYLWFWFLFLHPHPPPPIHPSPLPFFSLGSESHCVALGVLDSSAAWQENVINAKALAICSHSNLKKNS